MSSPMMSTSSIPAMLNNFKKKYISPLVQRSPPQEDDQLTQAEPQTETTDRDLLEETDSFAATQHWAMVMAETVCVPGCSCVFCRRRSDAGVGGDHTLTPPRSPRRYLRRSMPTTDSIMEVLYPASYLGTPGLSVPPAYFPGDSPSYPAGSNNTDSTQSYPSPTVTRTPVTPNHLDPLAEAPPLTGIPSPEASLRVQVPQAPPNFALDPPPVGLGIDILEEAEPPPEYTRFDQNRPRFPAASDVLGPYPSIPALAPAAR